MVRVVFFDLIGTLVDRVDRPCPSVTDALATIARFETGAGKPLSMALKPRDEWHTHPPVRSTPCVLETPLTGVVSASV